MNWKIKAHSLAVLSRLPGGRSLYRILQRWLSTDKTSADEYVQRAVEIVQSIREQGRCPRAGVFLEIGTGWKPFLPFLLSFLDAHRIMTLDVNPLLTKTNALKTLRELADRLPLVAKQLDVDLDELRERCQVCAPLEGSLHDLLEAHRIDYRCPADACATNCVGGSVDFVCSSNVLEHVPPRILQAMHRESFRILKPGGLTVHRFNPEDHFSFVDPSITAVHFLRFSENQWRWYGGTGLAYHNRLRCSQHRRLFEEAGFTIVQQRVRINQRALAALKAGTVEVHADFASFSPDELASDYMWVVGKRP